MVFFEYDKKVDWVITNPPWSQIKEFLSHSLDLADNVVFLFTINHLFTKARLRIIYNKGFGIKEICLINAPKELNASGFACGCVYLKKGWDGNIKLSQLKGYELV